MRPLSGTTWSSGLIPMIEPDAVTEILSRVSDLALILSEDMTIVGLMAHPAFDPAGSLARFEGKPMTETLTVESVPKFESRLAQHLENPAAAYTVELNHIAAHGQPEFPVRYSFHKVGSDGSILLLGRDLRPIAEMQQQLVSAQISLEREFESHRDQDTRFRVLLSALENATVFVSLPGGTISQYNPAAQALLGKSSADLTGTRMDRLFEDDGNGGVLSGLAGAAAEQTSLHLRATKDGQTFVIKPVLFRAGGGQVMLCRIMPSSAANRQADRLQDNLSGLYEHGVDAIVFARANGTILAANEAFQNMTNVASPHAVRERALSDFMSRGSVDVNVMFDNAARSGAMRLYATRLTSEFGAACPVEISTVRLAAGNEMIFALTIRDTSRAEAMRTPAAGATDVDVDSVVELIGSQSLKEIVAKTTDVVEKLSIETAVALTNNNRVAAAEMLGLSRQSLYVKLRKYDLLKQDKGGENVAE